MKTMTSYAAANDTLLTYALLTAPAPLQVSPRRALHRSAC